MDEDATQDAAQAQHLIVLVHGLWGKPLHLHHLRDTLAKEYEGDGLYIYIPKANSSNHTYDGIEVGAERITHELEAKIREIEEAGGKLRKISIIGYSLGGLISRYIVGLLYLNGVLDILQPMNFTTFATPHLGIRTPKRGLRAQIFNFLGSKTLSTSGQQMFIADDFRSTGRPLLSVMTDPNSVFVKGLSMFQKKTVYANTVNDRSVPFYTAAISCIDPFVDLDAVEVHPLPDQHMPVVLDPEKPVSLQLPRRRTVSWQDVVRRILDDLPFYAALCGVVPLVVPLFLVNAGYQTIKSAQRVRFHETGATVDLHRYRIPLLEETQAAQDRIVTHLAASATEHPGGENYLPTPPPEPATSPALSAAEPTTAYATKNDGPWPTLALTKEQFEMIENLDQYVGFQKFPVHIQEVRHTHAAIVVRMPKESFEEGRAVSRHWAKGFAV